MANDLFQEQRYNVRAAIPDHLDIFATWRRWSDAYKGECPGARIDLAYGQGEAEKLDFFPPSDGRKKAPLVVLIHGGYWQAMDKADNAFAARALNQAGAAVAVINHTLCPHIALDGIVDQIRHGVLWLWRNAENLSVDPERLFVIGHSAGGHLAAMAMCTRWSQIDSGAPADLLKGGMAISGLFDLSELVETSINDKVCLTQETARALSPVRHRPMPGARFIVAVGGDETKGFHDQYPALQQAWQTYGVNVECLQIPGCHHFQVFECLMNSGNALSEKACSLLA